MIYIDSQIDLDVDLTTLFHGPSVCVCSTLANSVR
jgi:hypothetical protein